MHSKMVKTIISLVLIFFLSNVTFSAIVSDNDGSTFVTKAEFDSLKDSFNKQISDYNDSIDGKIDGSIAQYLSGINIKSPPIDLVAKYKSSVGYMPIWYYDFSKQGTSSITPQFIKRQNVSYYRNLCNNLKLYQVWVGLNAARNDRSDYFAQYLCTGTPVWSGAYGYYEYSIAADIFRFAWGDEWLINDFVPTSEFTDTGWPAGGAPAKKGNVTYEKDLQSASIVETSNGGGSSWVYQLINGNKVLKYFATSIYPKYDVTINMHYYHDWPLHGGTINNYLKINTQTLKLNELPIINTKPVAVLGQTVSAGTHKDDTDTTCGNEISIATQLVKVTDGYNYMNMVWGATSSKSLYAVNEDYVGDVGTSTDTITTSSTGLKYDSYYYNGYGKVSYSQSYPSESLEYYPLEFNRENLKFEDFCNSTFTTIAGVSVKNGGGIPFCETSDEQEITLSIKLTDMVNSANHTKCKVTIASDQFVLGTIDASKKISSFEIYTDDATPHTEKFTLEKKGLAWVFIENEDNNNPIEMTICEVK